VRGAGATLALVGAVALLAGCAAWSPEPPASDLLLARADTLAQQGDVPGAAGLYIEVMNRYPDTPAALRARTARDALTTIQKLRVDLAAREADLVAVRRDLAARQSDLAARESALAARESELARVQQESAAREAELNKLRAEIVARQADITRLTAESDRLRADLDQLNRIDLRLEQSGAKRR
jgi:TolA-binding protein